MKKHGKTFLSILLATSLFSTSVSAANIDALKEEKQEATEKKVQFESQLEKVQSEMNTARAGLKKIADDIAKTEAAIQKKQEVINKTVKEIEKTTAEVEKTTIELEKKKEILAKNLRTLHMKGDVNMMEYLFRSGSVSEFFDRYDLMKRIAEANESLYEEVRAMKATLEKQKAHLESEKEKQVKAKTALVSLKEKQVNERAKEMELLKELVKKEQLIEDEIHHQEEAMALITQQINEEIRKREAERKRREAEAKKQNKPVIHTEVVGTGQFVIPVPAGRYFISSHFGYRTHPVRGTKHLHSGTDFAANLDTPILAADSGTVLYSGAATGYGNWIVIDHNNGYFTIYGHMYGDQLMVSVGEQVTRGQQIARVGSAGTSTGYHLHFCVTYGSLNNYLDPMNFF